MNCPVCSSATLFRKEFENHLQAFECSACFGRWIASHQYWKWKEQSGSHLPDPPSPEDVPPVHDSTAAKLCPECGHLLRRYPVGEGIDFTLDRCGNCGGMWFDKNEWEVLRAHGLHDNVHKIFSQIWQNRLRGQEHRETLDRMYREKFGPADYEKIKDIKQWIAAHPKQAELKAFLNL